jgi:hypothetical protein
VWSSQLGVGLPPLHLSIPAALILLACAGGAAFSGFSGVGWLQIWLLAEMGLLVDATRAPSSGSSPSFSLGLHSHLWESCSWALLSGARSEGLLFFEFFLSVRRSLCVGFLLPLVVVDLCAHGCGRILLVVSHFSWGWFCPLSSPDLVCRLWATALWA